MKNNNWSDQPAIGLSIYGRRPLLPPRTGHWISHMFVACLLIGAIPTGGTANATDVVRRCTELADFAHFNVRGSGIFANSTAGWYTSAEIQEIKDAYPVPAHLRGGKIGVFSSDAAEMAFIFPDSQRFYREQSTLRRLVERIRNEILLTLPTELRTLWETKNYRVGLQWSDGNEPLRFDHVIHVHDDHIVGVLAVEGPGPRVKINTGSDISNLDYKKIYEIGEGLPGIEYVAQEGELVVINGVHYPGGGLHAAPHVEGKIPARFTILVGIDR